MSRLISDGPPSVSTRRSPRSARTRSTTAGSTRSGWAPEASSTSASRAEAAAGVVDGLAAGHDQRRHLGAGEELRVVLEVAREWVTTAIGGTSACPRRWRSLALRPRDIWAPE